MTPLSNYLEDIIRQFRQYKELVGKALAQIGDEDLFRQIDDESNSISIIMKHLAGNMRSRWTDFLISDGEKPDRDRDSEFIMDSSDTRESIMRAWDAGWERLFGTLESLGPEDLDKIILIRNEPHTIMQAINRNLTHCAYHAGQIVFIARHFRGSQWKSLSVPKGKSREFNEMKRRKSGLDDPMLR